MPTRFLKGERIDGSLGPNTPDEAGCAPNRAVRATTATLRREKDVCRIEKCVSRGARLASFVHEHEHS